MENFENYFEAFTLKNKSNNAETDLLKTIFIINQVDSERFQLNKKIIEINTLTDDLAAGRLTHSMTPKAYLPAYVNSRIEAYQKIIQDQNKLNLSYKDNTYAYKQKEQEVNMLKTTLFNQLTDIKKGWLSALTELNQKKEKTGNGICDHAW